MGILDAPALPGGTVNPLVAVLRRNRANATLVLLGDSTGVVQNSTTDPRWCLLLARFLAAQYPAYTVNFRQWNDAGQVYDALPTTNSSQVVQTGTGTDNGGGPFVLTVYSGSVSGSSAEYLGNSGVSTRLSLMIPTAPELVICSYAKNSTETLAGAYRKHIWALVRIIKDFFPAAGVGLVVQCPNISPRVDIADLWNRLADVRALAASEGYWLADVAQAFVDQGDYTALLNADGIHPSPAGSALWAATVQRLFARTPLLTPPSAPPSRRFLTVPAKLFDALSGAPTYAVTNGHPAWAMPNSADSAIVADGIDLPRDWVEWNSYVIWFTAATTGSVTFTPRYGSLSTSYGNQSGGTTAPGALGPFSSAASGTTNNMRFLPCSPGVRPAIGQPVTLTLTRNGLTDSLAAAAQVVGFMFERAS